MLQSLEEFRHYKQNSTALLLSIVLQGMLNMVGKTEDSLVLTGSVMDYDEFSKTEKDNKLAVVMAHRNLLLVALRFESYNVIFERLRDMMDWSMNDPPAVIAVFYEAMAYAGFAQQGRNARRHCRKANKKLGLLEKSLKKGNPNLRHRVAILRAEIAAIHNKEGDSVSKMFEEAIKLSSRSGYIHDKALCHARAGLYSFEKRKDLFWAAHHIDCAFQAYDVWGAAGVASHLVNKYREVLTAFDKCSPVCRDLLLDSLGHRVGDPSQPTS